MKLDFASDGLIPSSRPICQWFQANVEQNQIKYILNLIFFTVYVDADSACNTAAFQLGQTAVGTILPNRIWEFKVRKGLSPSSLS